MFMLCLQVYSAFYKLQIEPYLKSPEELFALIGYRFNEDASNFETTDPPLTCDVWSRLSQAAFDLFIAAVECNICNNIFEAVSLTGGVTVADVCYLRSVNSGNVVFFIRLLKGYTQQDLHMRELDRRQTFWCCANCSKESSKGREVCDYCRYDNGGYLVPQSMVQPTKTADNQTTRAQCKAGLSAEDDNNRSILRLSSIVRLNSSVDRHNFDGSAHAGSSLKDSNCLPKTSTVDELVTSKKKHQFGTEERLHGDADCPKTGVCMQCRLACSRTSEYCVRCCAVSRSTEVDQSIHAQQADSVELSQQKIGRHSTLITSHPAFARNESDFKGGSQASIAPGQNFDRRDRDEIHYRANYDNSLVSRSVVGGRLPWTCAKCTFKHEIDTSACLACGSQRSDDGRDNSGCRTPVVAYQEKVSTERVDTAQDVKSEKSALWHCAWCTFANPAKKDQCKICHNLRHTRPTDTR